MVCFNDNIETANGAFVTIADAGLLHPVFVLAVFPIAVAWAGFWVCGSQAKTVAMISINDLAGELPQFLAAKMAVHGDFVLTARPIGKALPSFSALIVSASDPRRRCAGPNIKRRVANCARFLKLSSAKVTVIRAFVLMRVDEARLVLAVGVFNAANFLPATAGANNRAGVLCLHKSSLLAKQSYGNY